MRRVVSVAAVLLFGACGDNRSLLDMAVDAGVEDDAGNDRTNRPCTTTYGSRLSLRELGQVRGFALHSTSPPNDDRLFVLERDSRIRLFVDGELQEQPFLDLTGLIALDTTVERGLLGLAFHPRYAENGLFFVYYTPADSSVLARCSVSLVNPNLANPTCTPILETNHFTGGGHNAGMIEFGNDGYLYISTGDGGGAGDPNKYAQNPNSLLGKILRIDVDSRAPGLEYGIPPDNPYANGGGRPEVYIRGLRNPWRFSFDRATGDLWIGDVGQNRWEEMTVLRPEQQAGANLGWPIYEGNGCCATQDDRCLQLPGTSEPCDPTGMTFPQDARDRKTPRGTGWQSIIAGQTYRGSCYPDLVGWHIYTDFERADIIKARLLPDDTLEIEEIPGVLSSGTSSIHEGPGGELFVTNVSGMVYALEAGP